MLIWGLLAVLAVILVAVALSSDWDGEASLSVLGRRTAVGVGAALLVVLAIGLSVAELAGWVLLVLKLAGVQPVAAWSWASIVALIAIPPFCWILGKLCTST